MQLRKSLCLVLIAGEVLLFSGCVVKPYLRDEPHLYTPGFQKPKTKSYTDAKQRAQDLEACGLNQRPDFMVKSCMKDKGYVYFNHDICFRYGLDLGLCNEE